LFYVAPFKATFNCLKIEIWCKFPKNDLVKKKKKVSPKTFFLQLIDTQIKKGAYLHP